MAWLGEFKGDPSGSPFRNKGMQAVDDREIEELMEDVASVMKSLVSSAVSPLMAEIGRLKSEIAALSASMPDPTQLPRVTRNVVECVERVAGMERELAETRAAIPSAISEAVAAIPAPAPGKDGIDGAPGRDGEPGKDADPEQVAETVRGMIAADLAVVTKAVNEIPLAPELPDIPAMIDEAVTEAIRAIPAPEPGRDADPEVTAELVRSEVAKAVAALPAPQDGRSVTVEELAPLIVERLPAVVAEAVARIPVPKDGEPGKEGPPGKLPLVKAWTDEVHHEGDVVTHDGATYQASRDTGKEPPHDDWICIAAPGRDGLDARSFRIRGTFAEGGDYLALDVVALNGASFVAKRDDPGPCPGEGWQLVAAQGKRGQPGERGLPGQKGERGGAGPAVADTMIDDEGMLTLVNADGSTVNCDLYPILSRVASARAG